MGSIIIYQLQFTNAESDDVLVQITDRQNFDSTGDNTVTYIDLLGVAPALELETFNVNEDKFNPILGLRATIRFKSTNQVNFTNFSSGEDYRFFVRATTGSSFLFSGWLVMDDNQQDFLPPGQPVTLYATDNFGALKDIELSDFNDARPSGRYRLIEIIAWCLRKTEGPYPSEGAAVYDGIKVAFNLFEANHHTNVNNCPLNQTYVDVLSFEKNINEFEDCYTVLYKILLSLGCRLCQYNNYWYILRIDEYKNSAFVVHNYGLGANYISRTNPATFDKNLDSDEIDFIEAQTIQRIQRPYKSSAIKVNHDFPKELPCNSAFLRGTQRLDSTSTEVRYDPECWTLFKGIPNVANDGDFWITKLVSAAGYETDRYLTFQVQPANALYYGESQPVYCCAGDRINVSVDIRHNGQVETASGAGSYNVMQVRLYADNGEHWILDPGYFVAGIYKWIQSDATWSTNNRFFDRVFDGVDDDEAWQTITFEDGRDLSPDIPLTGYLTVLLVQVKKPNQFETHFQNLRFTYIPKIDGSYKKFTGEQYKMFSLLRYSKRYEETYYLFDAPCKSFKYALNYFDTPNYYPTANWIDFAMELFAIPDLLDFAYSFLHWQVNAAWNQNRLETRLLPSRLKGLDVANGYAGLIHKYSVLNDLAYVDLNFIILSYRQDWHNCTWNATFSAINDEGNVRQGGNSNGENFEFKYLE